MKLKPPIVYTCTSSPLGLIWVAATPHGIAGAWFEGQQHFPDTTGWTRDDQLPLLRAAVQQLAEYLAGQRQRFDLPLDLQGGTAFQQAVWQGLLAIPRGQTTSYQALSQRIGRPAAVRAVGAAIGRNPVSVVVPCHRVLGSNGSLTGYAGGLHRKTALLQLEGAL